MRLLINQDESSEFRRLVRRELDLGSTFVSVTLKMDKENASRVLERSADGQMISVVWSCGFEGDDA